LTQAPFRTRFPSVQKSWATSDSDEMNIVRRQLLALERKYHGQEHLAVHECQEHHMIAELAHGVQEVVRLHALFLAWALAVRMKKIRKTLKKKKQTSGPPPKMLEHAPPGG